MEDRKQSAYQKLKAENLKLKQDIYSILIEKDFAKCLPVRLKWEIYFATENLIWGGGNG